MANAQNVIFTPVPASIQLDPAGIRVSVVVSPRLSGDDTLGAYRNWVRWAHDRKASGLNVTFACAGSFLRVALDTSQIRENLWAALFDDDTYVRSYEFDDYSDSFIPSYSTRTALGLLQSTYQTAGVDLALPPVDGDRRELTGRQRARLRSLLSGFAVGWDAEVGPALRDRLRRAQQQARAGTGFASVRTNQIASRLDSAGLIATGVLDPDSAPFQGAQQLVAGQYEVFNHQPQGAEVTSDSLDREHVLDFHQALGAIGSYRTLQRDLGLVYDLELPLDFVAQTSLSQPGDLSIVAVDVAWDQETTTTVPATRTAYVHATVGGRTIFAVAPLALTEPGRPGLIGLLDLDKRSFGLAQLDVDGALHKTIRQADSLAQLAGEQMPPTVDVFDPATALSSLRSGGLTLFADSRALVMLSTFDRSARHNTDLELGQPQQEPFYAEDLTRGYRLDIWDTVTKAWHSLHRRNSTIHVGTDDITITVADDEGFFQAAATQAAPEADGSRANTDLHLHEAMARWSGWSLSAPMVGTHLTRSGDPEQALPDPDHPDPENEAVTPFVLTSEDTHVKGSLPRLRFGVGYRLRVRQVDLANNGVGRDDEECAFLTPHFSMPRLDGVIPYLRFEPVAPPVVVVRDPLAITGRGSAADRLVIRTYNDRVGRDGLAADRTASDRHIAPPGVHVELAERHGMFDDSAGALQSSPAMWQLIRDRDAGAFASIDVAEIVIGTDAQKVPVEPDPSIDSLPYLPDPLARAAAVRNLPGTSRATVGRVGPGAGADEPVPYEELADAQPRPGTATVVEYGGRSDWQEVKPFRLALTDGTAGPHWDPVERVLTVSLPKGSTHVVPLSSCPDPDDLKYLGVWSWLREYVEHLTTAGSEIQSAYDESPAGRDRLAHVLQLAIEGGHPMLTPPHLLTLVSAVQQPIGRPGFRRLTAQIPLVPTEQRPYPTHLRTQPEADPTADTELEVLSSWRELGSTDAFLVGALDVHGQSTDKVDLHATWTDPVDDLVNDPGEQEFSAAVDEMAFPDLRRPAFGWTDNVLHNRGDQRPVGYYVREHDLVVFGPVGTTFGLLPEGDYLHEESLPRHRIGDTKHHVVSYTAIATSRYRDYFDATDGDGKPRDFTRSSAPVVVHVPASARPVAPLVRYVVPTFGWERVVSANQGRSVRTGGGLRIYLDRPWNSSGVDELLGVSLTTDYGIDREKWKPFVTQWGQDPIWDSAPLPAFPSTQQFPDATAAESDLPLDAVDPQTGAVRMVAVAGHEVRWDSERRLYYCDLTVETGTATYAPFVRLALVRYQPYALLDAKLSRVVLADFAQLTPERALTVTADPYVPGVIQVTVSGPAPRGPVPTFLDRPLASGPTEITVSVQRKDPNVNSDLAWSAAPEFVVQRGPGDPSDPQPQDFIVWSGSVRAPEGVAMTPGQYRLLVEEHEVYLTDRPHRAFAGQGAVEVAVEGAVEGAVEDAEIELRLRPSVGRRLSYAETVPLDETFLAQPPFQASSTTL